MPKSNRKRKNQRSRPHNAVRRGPHARNVSGKSGDPSKSALSASCEHGAVPSPSTIDQRHMNFAASGDLTADDQKVMPPPAPSTEDRVVADTSAVPNWLSSLIPDWLKKLSQAGTAPAIHVAAKRRQKVAKRLLAVCLSLAVAQGIVMSVAPERKSASPPPLEIRIEATTLSTLPVGLGLVQSCGCWDGDDGQAAKKFKFAVSNRWNRTIGIGGGDSSSIRLLIAYVGDFLPKQTIPTSSYRRTLRVATPPDEPMHVADGSKAVIPLRIYDDANLFHLPNNFKIWGLVPSPNGVVTSYTAPGSPGVASFGTVVDTVSLNPGDTYRTDRLGHGSWVFPVPLPKQVSDAVGHADYSSSYSLDGFHPVSVEGMASVEQYMIIIGIGIFAGDPKNQLIGFAPAPPHGLLEEPSAF